MNPKGTYRGTGRPDIETQTVYHNFGVTVLNPLDSSFYTMSASQWGSVPAANGYGFNLTMKSRLYGNISGVSISFNSTNASAPSTEPVGVEIHIRNSNFPIVTSGIRIIKIGEINVQGSRFNNICPSFIPCNVPIQRGESFNLVLRTPAWATNPTDVKFTGLVFIEGVSSRKKPNINGIGLKNYDMCFNSATNTSPADSTSYYFLQLNTALTTSNSNLWWQVSPYAGNIEEVTLHNINASGVAGSSEPFELRAQVLSPDNNRIVGDYLLRYFTCDMAPGTGRCEITKCKVSVKKGECVNVYYKAPVLATNPTLIRTLVYLHVRGY